MEAMNLPQDNEHLRAKIYNISLTPINDIYYVPPGVSGSVGLNPAKINQILALFQAEQTRLKAELIAELRKGLPENPASVLPKGVESHHTYNDGTRDTVAQVTAALDTLERGA